MTTKKPASRKAAGKDSSVKKSAAARSASKPRRSGGAIGVVLPAKTGVVPVVFEQSEHVELNRRSGPIKVESAIPMRPAKPRSKGAPPPVIAKPKPKPKSRSFLLSDKPRKKIDYTTAVSVSIAAAAQAAEADAQGYVVICGRRIRVLSSMKAKAAKKAARKAGKPLLRFSAPNGPKLTRAELHRRRVQAEVLARTQDGLPEHVKNVKTKLSKKELQSYRDLLLARRAELVGRVQGLEDDALRPSGGNLSNMPLHMADVGTDTYDQDFALGLAGADRLLLVDIDEALVRIEEKTYGVCLLTGTPIPKARLQAKPWARYTIEAARRMEQIRAMNQS